VRVGLLKTNFISSPSGGGVKDDYRHIANIIAKSSISNF
jgi:hypothetical protein